MGYSDYIKECQEQMKKAMEALDSLVGDSLDDTEDEEKCCCEEKCCYEPIEQATFKVRVFAMSGSVIEIEGVSEIRRQPEEDTTEFYLLDKNYNMIASFVANNVVGIQKIKE